jgi:hypothetical protein
VGLALGSGYVAYDASKKSQRYNEQVAEQNQKVVAAQGVDAARLGQLEEDERRLKTRLQLAEQQTAFGAQNVDQTGTALDILGDTSMFGEIDLTRIRANTQRKVWGYAMQGHDIETNTRLNAFKGKAERQGTILSTASSVAGSFGSFAKPAAAAPAGGGQSWSYTGPTAATYGYR